LLGHISPAISLQHYIHTQALVHAAVTLRAAEDVPTATLGVLGGLGKTQAYQHRNRVGVLGLARRCTVRTAAPRLPAVSPPHTPASVARNVTAVPSVSQPVPSGPTLTEVLLALNGAAPPTLSPELVEALRQALAGFDRVTLLRCFGQGAVRADWRPPMPQRHEERDFLQRLQQALARASVHQCDVLRRGIAVHFAHYDASRRDVVFRGAYERQDFEDYVRFLQCLPVDWAQHLRFVRRTPQRRLPAWIGAPPEWMRSLPIDHIAPPRRDAAAFAHWVGFRYTAKPGGRCRAQVVLVTWLLWALVDGTLWPPDLVSRLD
jgi:hypothetical protein